MTYSQLACLRIEQLQSGGRGGAEGSYIYIVVGYITNYDTIISLRCMIHTYRESQRGVSIYNYTYYILYVVIIIYNHA